MPELTTVSQIEKFRISGLDFQRLHGTFTQQANHCCMLGSLLDVLYSAISGVVSLVNFSVVTGGVGAQVSPALFEDVPWVGDRAELLRQTP